ncbi:MAG: sulfotransferase [Pseudomonadota bacterium]
MSSHSQHETILQEVERLVADRNFAAAVARLKGTLKADPQFFQGWLRLSKILFETENYREAVQVGQAAERFDPLQAEFRTIQSHMQSRAFGPAEQVAKQMLAKQPGHPRAVFTIAEISGMKNYPEGRVEALRHGLDYGPANLVLRNMLISALEQAGDFQGAIDEARILVQTEDSFNALWSLVSVLLRHGRNDELLAVCDRAEQQSGADKTKLSQIDLVRGQILRVLGRRDESVAAYRKCLENNPSNAGAWWALADMKTFAFSSADSAAIRSLLDTPTLPQPERCVATFALAKASESEGDWDQTFALYHAANALHPNAAYNPAIFDEEVASRIAGFDQAALATQAIPRPEGPTPIFILGLPRSGSTLIEQILASHSEIEGTIEQPVMPSIARKAHVKCTLEHQGGLLQKVGALTPQDLAGLGQAYLDDGGLFRTGETEFFTDKLPFNFRHIGLIHKVLPNAIIIDARRNPMDCGLSLYKQHFPTGVEFSYGLQHIADFYVGYLKLMDYWHAALPGRVLTLQYEHLIRDPEAKIRELLSHIGVAFEPACLNFHKTERAVRTASSEQVRQPINTRGIGAWRQVEEHLAPLKAGLGADVYARFEGLYDA